MNKQFVPYDVALKLKELGFDEPCFGVYHRDSSLMSIVPEFIRDTQCNYFGSIINSECVWENDEESINGIQEVSAPLYQQAFRWFKEKHGLYTEMFVDDDKTFGFMITYFIKEERVDKPIECQFKTYEEAELACLKLLIEIVKNKKQ